MLKSHFQDKSKNRVEHTPSWRFDGIPVKRQRGMIYWYSWGKHTFDIRTMRRVLGLPEEHPADKWFMAPEPDANGSFEALMLQLQVALAGQPFAEAIKAHDKAMDEDIKAYQAAEAARRQALTRQHFSQQPRAATQPDPFDDAPF